MKKIYLLLGVIPMTTLLNAQPIIQSTDLNPVPGDAMNMVNCNWVSEGSAGNNMTWDLSAQSANSNYILSVSAAGGSTPNANIDLNYGGQSHMYLLCNTSGQQIYNQLAGTTMITFSNPMQYMEFPLNSTMNFTDNFVATFTSSGYSFSRAGDVEGTADGYGTLITPEGTFNNVIRVRYTQIYTDTYSLGTIDYDVETYAWYKAGYHGALASVTSLTTFQGTQMYSEYMEVSTLGVEENTIKSVLVYPNPVSNELNIQLNDTEIASISILDLNGNTVKIVTKSYTQIDVSELNSGLYFVAVKDMNGAVSTTKFIKK